jgi:hypothetical protein
MKKILLILIPLMVAGCQGYSKIEFYESGKIKSIEKNEGMIEWSNGKSIGFSVIGK